MQQAFARACVRVRERADLHLFAGVHHSAYVCVPVYVQVRIKRATPETSERARETERERFYLFSAVVRRFCLFHFVLFAAKYVFLKFQFGHGDGDGDVATTATIATRWAWLVGKIRWQCLVCSSASASLFGKAPV